MGVGCSWLRPNSWGLRNRGSRTGGDTRMTHGIARAVPKAVRRALNVNNAGRAALRGGQAAFVLRHHFTDLYGLSMVPFGRLWDLVAYTDRVLADGVPGAFVEC